MFLDRICELLRFDKEDERFELLETEHGAHALRYVRGERKGGPSHDFGGTVIPEQIELVKERLSREFSADINKDLIMRSFKALSSIPVLLVYMSGMADDSKINDYILRPLMSEGQRTRTAAPDRRRVGAAEKLLQSIRIAEAKLETDLGKACIGIMDGMTALFIQNESRCLMLETHGFEKRSVGQAENETVVLGPKESFTESMRTNITLIRRTIHTRDLVARIMPSGGCNNTSLALVYRKGVANEALVMCVEKRLNKVRLRALLSSGMTEQLIEDRHVLPVPQTLSTERPDRAASHIMQGCLCLIIEGSPLAVILPVTLFSLMNTPEDVYLRRPLGTLLRITRYAGALISLLLPGYFLAMAMYHQGGLTTEVLSTVIASRQMVFEPIAVEMILLLLVFQLIREAGLRVPGSIGQAIGIIGGLIMGQAAVTANLASSVVLIIVALSGLGNFCIPDYSLQIAAAYFRMAMVAAAWIGGLLGMVAAWMIVTALLAGQKSFGVPFLAPYSPKAVARRPLLIRGALGGSLRADDINNAEQG